MSSRNVTENLSSPPHYMHIYTLHTYMCEYRVIPGQTTSFVTFAVTQYKNVTTDENAEVLYFKFPIY
jgi:hypothetical protein